MRSRISLMLLLVGALANATQPGARPAPRQGVIDPRADRVLHQMSDHLSSMRSLRVDATSVDEKFTRDGHKIQTLQTSRIALERPNRMRVDRLSPAGRTVFIYDGQRFGVYNRDRNIYAAAPAPPRLGPAIDDASARLQFDAPGGDLLVNDPYRSLTEGALEGRYIGLEPIDGVMAHHIAVTTKNKMLWQIWIKDGRDAVPLRYVVTSEDLPGHPEFTIDMRNWQPNAPIAADAFSFVAPPGARRVAFAPPRAG